MDLGEQNKQQELVALIKKLPLKDFRTAKLHLEFLIQKNMDERLQKKLENAPEGKRKLSSKEIKRINEAKKEAKAGKTRGFNL